MKSIQTKFAVLMISGLLTMSLLLGGTCLAYAVYEWKENLKTTLNTVCEEQTLRMDNQLDTIRQATMIIYNYALSRLTSVKELQDEAFFEEYNEKVSALAQNVADHTEGTLGVYFHYNPEIMDPRAGFFWSRKELKGELQETSPTDLSRYTEEDEDKTCWYYQPVKAGEPTWTHSYYNDTIGVEMISYGIPFYVKGTLVGVIGIDVDFSYLVDLAQEGAVYENGRGNLVDLKQRLVYFRKPGDKECTIRTIDISDHFYNTLRQAENNKGKLLPFSYQGAKSHMTYQTLSNGMKYVLLAPVAETNRPRNHLLVAIILVTGGILCGYLIFTTYMTKKIVRPLKELDHAAREIADGNMDVNIACTTNDEVKTLTDSILQMAQNLKSYVKEINGLVYRDGLTGVKNKMYYFEYIKSLSGEKDNKPYAVVIFSVLGLAKVNKKYGRSYGDALVMTACQAICREFSHSPIFRIGGDEFVAFLKGSDYMKLDELLQQFEEHTRDKTLVESPDIPVEIVYGVARSDGGDEEYDEVFHRADQEMFDKKKMKGI